MHTLDKGSGPILFSIETLRSLGAIIDFEHDLICFRKLSQLEQSSSGHQLVPLVQDWYHASKPTKRPVPSLKDFIWGQLLPTPESAGEREVRKSRADSVQKRVSFSSDEHEIVGSDVVGRSVDIGFEPKGKSQGENFVGFKHEQQQQQPADAAAHSQDPSLSVDSSEPPSGHVQSHQGGTCAGHAGPRRDTAQELDSGRDDGVSCLRVEAGEGHPFTSPGIAENSISSDDGRAQCSEAQEVFVAGAPSEKFESSDHGQREWRS